jgi:hypothetical protein
MKKFWDKLPWFKKSQDVSKTPEPSIIPDPYIYWEYDLVSESIKLSKDIIKAQQEVMGVPKIFVDDNIFGVKPSDYGYVIKYQSHVLSEEQFKASLRELQIDEPKVKEEKVDLGWGFDDRE